MPSILHVPLDDSPDDSTHVCATLIQDEDLSFTLPQLLATTRGKFTVACELLALVRAAHAVRSCRAATAVHATQFGTAYCKVRASWCGCSRAWPCV